MLNVVNSAAADDLPQATDAQLAAVHSAAHIARVERLAADGLDMDGEPAPVHGGAVLVSGDIYATPATAAAARSAAGCAIQACARVRSPHAVQMSN